MVKLKTLAVQIIAAELQAGLENGLIPPDCGEDELESFCESNVELLYDLICSDSEIKAKVVRLQQQNLQLTLEQIFTICPA